VLEATQHGLNASIAAFVENSPAHPGSLQDSYSNATPSGHFLEPRFRGGPVFANTLRWSASPTACRVDIDEDCHCCPSELPSPPVISLRSVTFVRRWVQSAPHPDRACIRSRDLRRHRSGNRSQLPFIEVLLPSAGPYVVCGVIESNELPHGEGTGSRMDGTSQPYSNQTG